MRSLADKLVPAKIEADRRRNDKTIELEERRLDLEERRIISDEQIGKALTIIENNQRHHESTLQAISANTNTLQQAIMVLMDRNGSSHVSDNKEKTLALNDNK